MSDIGKPERETQNRVVALFRDDLGYKYLGDWSARHTNSNIEEKLLGDSLTRAGYTEDQIRRTIYRLKTEAENPNRSLYDNNKALYSLLRYGMPVKIEAGKVTETVKVINWDKPEKNDFYIAEEVTLHGNLERRPDLVLYINGIAVTVIELKNSHVSIGDGIRQDIKNVHLSVHPPTGRVRISAPQRMDLDTIRIFAISKLGWIRQHQQEVRNQERETPREFLDRESHYAWGRRYLLQQREVPAAPRIEISHKRLQLQIRPGTTTARKESLLDEWYRGLVKQAAPPLITKWEKLMGVRLEKFFVQRMKTKWGSCTPGNRTVRLNSELAKKPAECLEYIVVHEMAHLLEPTHNGRFIALMDRFMPRWQAHRQTLNRLPVRHEHWGY